MTVVQERPGPLAPAGLPPDDELLAVVEATIDAAVSAAFRAEAAAHTRPPHQFSMSRLGKCTRAGAYALAGTPADPVPPPVGEDRPAAIGTWIHAGLLPRLVDQFGTAVAEQACTLLAAGLQVASDLPTTADRVPGSSDLVVVLLLPDGTLLVVVDLKTVGERKLSYVRRRGLFAEHRIQVHGYATAQYQAGRPVRAVAWLYLDRSTGASMTIVEPFTNSAALEPISRVAELRAWADLDPDRAPRTNAAGKPMGGPGLDLECNGCAWLERCWGPGAGRRVVGAQANLAATDEGVEAACLMLADATDRATAAERDKKIAKAILAGTRRGLYGSWLVDWKGGGMRDDQKAMAELLRQMGVPIPRSDTAQYVKVAPVAKLTKTTRRDWADVLGEGDLDGPPDDDTGE